MSLTGLVASQLSGSVNTVIGIINIVIALVSIFIGIMVAKRLEGKLKSAIIFLIFAVLIIMVREILILANITPATFIVGLMRIATVLLILLAAINMRSMIDSIDNHYRKR